MKPAAAVALVLLAACAPLAPAPAEPELSARAWLLPGTDWRLVELDGAPFTATVTARLTEDGRVIGQAPCNRFSAPYAGRWPDLTFAPVASTRIACPNLTEEKDFFATLGLVNHAVIGDEGLTFTGPSGAALRFVRV